MALKCRGMGKAMKRRFAEGGSVGPNSAQRAFGSTIFDDTRRRREAEAGLTDAKPVAPAASEPKRVGDGGTAKRVSKVLDTPERKTAQRKQLQDLLNKPLD